MKKYLLILFFLGITNYSNGATSTPVYIPDWKIQDFYLQMSRESVEKIISDSPTKWEITESNEDSVKIVSSILDSNAGLGCFKSSDRFNTFCFSKERVYLSFVNSKVFRIEVIAEIPGTTIESPYLSDVIVGGNNLIVKGLIKKIGKPTQDGRKTYEDYLNNSTLSPQTIFYSDKDNAPFLAVWVSDKQACVTRFGTREGDNGENAIFYAIILINVKLAEQANKESVEPTF